MDESHKYPPVTPQTSDADQSSAAPTEPSRELNRDPESLYAVPYLAASGDPWPGKNPFTPDQPGHSLWKLATMKAEAKEIHLRSTLVIVGPYGVILERIVHGVCAEFDIWAERQLHGVGSVEAVALYDGWLLWYAESLRFRATEEVIKLAVRPSLDQRFRDELRFQLGERVQHWKREARLLIPEQQSTGKLPVVETSLERIENGHLACQGDAENLGNRETTDDMWVTSNVPGANDPVRRQAMRSEILSSIYGTGRACVTQLARDHHFKRQEFYVWRKLTSSNASGARSGCKDDSKEVLDRLADKALREKHFKATS